MHKFDTNYVAAGQLCCIERGEVSAPWDTESAAGIRSHHPPGQHGGTHSGTKTLRADGVDIPQSAEIGVTYQARCRLWSDKDSDEAGGTA